MRYRATRKAFAAVCAFALGSCVSASAVGADMRSDSYSIRWDVLDSGGSQAASFSYDSNDSIGRPFGTGRSVSASYTLQGGFLAPPDSDADAYRDFVDNCILDQNPDQRDSDGDGYGNLCDADLNNDGIVNVIDIGLFKQRFFTADPHADLNGDGIVNVIDIGIFKQLFFEPPGPSGTAP